MRLYLKVNILNEKITRNIYPYYERQLIEYQEQERHKYMKEKRFPNSKKLEDNKFFYFWDFEELIEKVEPQLQNKGRCVNYDALDSYYIQIDKIGIAKEKIANVVKVITIRNTNHIIDMLPYENIQHRKLLIPEHPIKLTVVD